MLPHTRRITLLVAGCLAVALVVRKGLSTYLFGSEQAQVLAGLRRIAAQEPVHQGEAACGECHSDIFEIHGKDVHQGVQCEDCHGSGRQHVRFQSGESGVPEKFAKMPKRYTLEGCLFCHRELVARPRDFPQVNQAEHYAFLHVTDKRTACVACHSPHEPLYLLTKSSEARIHPVIQECRYCHDREPEGDYRSNPGHPVIFECRDCHAPVVSDFEKRTHAFLRCTACHLFHRENQNAGRIYKNGNRRFCLLCHAEQPFRDRQKLPQIDADRHINSMADAMGEDAKSLASDPRACLHCHFENIHDKNLRGQGRSVLGVSAVAKGE